ncbi:hypothetical protein EJ05DRAFT_220204 [Pseudovirgaria hyperparasitica]|uniref:Uncharacterized protein n=1 Tax=Pseudovirgaria hyperparasitica TaxID=470096 RepID=A0A6A6VW92_9PEZI|nr:uncharacterized protein EJ05DRAFT_220204 [Pseudovirgaria hyperparasitica]KAF2753517.1 hypothetical protein EJ05DRAFT_220204 [Pseudovirgaria hyperparasitica]
MDASGTPDKSGGKRRLFGFGKKKDAEKGAGPTSTPAPLNAASLQSSSSPQATSPGRSPRIPSLASPSQRYRSSSPRMHSPASSQIFERNVQESTLLPGELSPAIPAHITTEDHIPPALEASTIAITDDHLNPDDVQIVTHSAHHPASAAVSGTPHESMSQASPASEELAPPPAIPLHLQDEAGSNYGSIDTGDPRRLSFISFADVVQAEHDQDDRDALNLMSLSSTTNRSPSPVRSPASSHNFGSPSPPTSVAASVRGLDNAVKAPGSPTTATGTHSPSLSGELNIETMRQALRKTGSGDLGGSHVQPVSPISAELPNVDQTSFR